MSRAGSPSRGTSIAIVGGGIIGLSTAWRLTQSGRQVAVYDQGPIGHEASWAGAGMLSPGGEIDSDSPLVPLAMASRRLYPGFVRELEQASGVEIDYQECGGLDLAYSAAELTALEQKAATQASLGIASKAVTASHILQFWPRIRREGLTGGRFYPGDGIVNPRQVLQALNVACERLGVALKPNCAVTGAELSGDSVLVHSPLTLDKFDAVVISAGAWSNSIKVSGVPPLPSVEPVKGHLIGYRQPEQTCNTIVRHGHAYLLQRANGLLIVGASVEHAGFDRNLKPEIIENLAGEAGFVFPHLSETTHSEAWIGFRPASENLRLGCWYSPRLYLGYGHYRNGILLAPVSAQRLASEINANFEKR